jgi:hypothetical protein
MQRQGRRLLFFRWAVLARIRIEAGLSKPQAIEGLSGDDMRVYDFLNVGFRHMSVPHRFGIDHDSRPVFALVEASSLIGAHTAFQPALGKFLFEELLQPGFGGGIAASSRMAGRALIPADKNMSLKFRHQAMVGMLLFLC